MGRRGSLVARAVLAVLFVSALASPAGAVARPQQVEAAPPKAFIVVDVATGRVLLADHHHDALPPASTSKVMTALTAVERLPADALIDVSDLAASQPPSRISMVAGHRWPFSDALASLMMASANDAAYAIAETAGGNLDGFAAAMTETAERLGLQESTFSDPAGFDDEASFGGGPRMSAYDIAVVTRNALEVPEITRWAALRTHEFVDPAGQPRSLTNHNKMLPGASRAYQFATGYKTGYTEQAGHTLVATATKDGRSLITVVLGTWDTYGWATQLLEQGFATPVSAALDESLPDVAVSPYGQRAADRAAYLAFARGAATSPAGPGTTPDAPPSTTDPTATSTVPSSIVDGEEIVNEDAAPEAGAGDGGGVGFVSARTFGLVVVLLVAGIVVLRRRAVRRQRARRISRQRSRAARMRSGGLTVVDGRYRTGTRVGPPVESHVRIQRIDDA
jgi:D-alanyl-D-alanine carboxypeptidase